MGGHQQLATWLVTRRRTIEDALAVQLREGGGNPPSPASPEAEALRRFRSFAVASLRQGEPGHPALDGLRVNTRRTTRLVQGWSAAAAACAGPDGAAVASALEPLVARFVGALRETGTARRASGAARPSNRRAVSAAIDRIADAFLAVDTDNGTIVDANPAAGALLGLPRDALLGQSIDTIVPEPARDAWWVELDAIGEGDEPRRARSRLLVDGDRAIPVDLSMTRFHTRRWTLALVLARPLPDAGERAARSAQDVSPPARTLPPPVGSRP